ncbi:MAG: hypothetical protein PHU40_07925 [Sulfurimonas sp.]|nr:hypothetical protein [Sulfurimonas sp.]
MKSWLFLLFSLPIFGDDIERVEAVVQEIQTLRSDYESCNKQLQTQRKDSIVADVSVQTPNIFAEKNQELQQILEEKETLLKLQEEKILSLKQKNIFKTQAVKEPSKPMNIATKEVVRKTFVAPKSIVCQERNPFPKLIMKEVKK